MAARVEAITRRPAVKYQAWKDLGAHFKKVRDLHLRQLFAEDAKRGQRLSSEAVGLFLDYSKNRITDETLKLLIQLAEESRLRERVDAMFRGETINITEKRAVLHTALRASQRFHRGGREERRSRSTRSA
jgi:glucose-6-phosphate isomerase